MKFARKVCVVEEEVTQKSIDGEDSWFKIEAGRGVRCAMTGQSKWKKNQTRFVGYRPWNRILYFVTSRCKNRRKEPVNK